MDAVWAQGPEHEGDRRAGRRGAAALALCLLLPVPSVGTVLGMVLLPGTTAGRVLFFAAKAWVLLLPLLWLRHVARGRPSLSAPRKGGFGASVLLGLALSGAIVLAYVLLGRRLIDQQAVKEMAGRVGLGELRVYLGGVAYWVLVNSLLEEYVWRWFVFRRFEELVPSGPAVFASALGFTLHHVVALRVYFPWSVVVLASIGILVGGSCWSWCYVRYRSIWPGYVSHAIVDVTVFAIGYMLIFR